MIPCEDRNLIIITGISGLLGPHVANAFLKAGYGEDELLGIYNSTVPIYDKIPTKKIDLTDETQVSLISPNSQIIHCAAMTDVNLCESKPDVAKLINANMTRIICEHASRSGSNVVYISSESVFYDKFLSDEKTVANPMSVYHKTKRAGEDEVLKFKNNLVLRTNMFGPSLNGGSKLFEHCYDNLKKGMEVKAISDNIFNPVSVIKLGELIVDLCEKKGVGIYNISSDDLLSRYTLYKLIADAFDLDHKLVNELKLNELNSNVPRTRFAAISNTKIKTYLNIPRLCLFDQLQSIKQFLETNDD